MKTFVCCLAWLFKNKSHFNIHSICILAANGDYDGGDGIEKDHLFMGSANKTILFSLCLNLITPEVTAISRQVHVVTSFSPCSSRSGQGAGGHLLASLTFELSKCFR